MPDREEGATLVHRRNGEMMKLGLGIDTGGTFTDSVIMDLENGHVIRKAKALTTRENLIIGIKNSLSGLGKRGYGPDNPVSIFSTLARNSLVEGKGCRITHPHGVELQEVMYE